MKLINFRVQNFRSVWDSGWISCQNITAIAGTNEAGKSNIMRALWKLKPAFKQDNKILHSDIPRDMFEKIMAERDMPVFITARFKLEARDLGALKKLFPQIKPFDICTVSRTLSGSYRVEVPVEVPEKSAQKLYDFIVRIVPGFIYYSNYGNLDSNIYLPQMLNKFNKSGVSAESTIKRRTIKLLLMYAGITPEMLHEDMPKILGVKDASTLTAKQLKELLDKKKEYKDLFAAAGAKLSDDFNKWWRQGNYNFELIFEGDNLKIWVTDTTGNRAPLEERSVGMQWFLSFFLVFSLESEFFYSNTVLLLDESGMTLHSLAQQDLVKFFERLAKNNQLLYSTHSSFMLPTEHLNRTKVVYRDRDGHSVVTNELTVNSEHSNEASLMPIHSAVGLELSKSILNGCTPVIVTRPADQHLLSGIKNYLSGKGRFRAFNELIFVTSGANGIDGVAQILGGSKDLPNVFLPGDHDGLQMKEYLLNNIYKSNPQYIISVDKFGQYLTLEDTFPASLIEHAAGAYLGRFLGTGFKLTEGEPYLKQMHEFAHRSGAFLPPEFPEEVAKRVKLYLMREFMNINVPRKNRKVWENILNSISYIN